MEMKSPIIRRLFVILECFGLIPILFYFYKLITEIFTSDIFCFPCGSDNFKVFRNSWDMTGTFLDHYIQLKFLFVDTSYGEYIYFEQSFITLFSLTLIVFSIPYIFIILVKWIVYGKFHLYKIGKD